MTRSMEPPQAQVSMPRFNVERLQNRVVTIHYDLSSEVVGHDVTRSLRVQRFLRLSAQVDG